MTVQMTQPDLAEIVGTAISLMLGIDLGEPVDGELGATYEIGASVQLLGDWEGAVVVACSNDFGRQAAAEMFGTPADAITGEEITDALGELANMIGGNVKPLLPGAEHLSLPTVIQGRELHLNVPGTAPRVEVGYRQGDAEIAVRILQRT